MTTQNRAVCAALALAFCSGAYAQVTSPFEVSNFSATMVTTLPGQNMEVSARWYKSGDKMRMEMGNMPKGGAAMAGSYMLTSMKEQTSYMVMGGMCMKISMAGAGGRLGPAANPNPFTAKGSITRKELGSETVDGHPAKITEMTITSDDGKKMVMKAWLASDLKDFPLRVEIESPKGPMRMNFKDVSLSAPDSRLFESPTNCGTMPAMRGLPH